MKYLIVVIILISAAPTLGQETPTPAPTPTPLVVPGRDMMEAIATGDANLRSLPSDLTNPGGAILPDADSGAPVLAYAKWLISPGAAVEYAGPFAPIVSHVGIAVGVLVALGAVYIIIYIVVYVIRWVIWLFKMISLLIETVGSFLGGGLGWLLKIFGG